MSLASMFILQRMHGRYVVRGNRTCHQTCVTPNDIVYLKLIANDIC
jgi:hypothetical protein